MCVCVLSAGFMFFLFKQKTADEMRISDWSSDVCSSDLQYGFPCAGFARKYGEPRFELDLRLVDDDEIADMQGAQHVVTRPRPKAGACGSSAVFGAG